MSDTEIRNGLMVDEFNTKRWYKNDVLHRENDLPAIEYTNGDKIWYINGLRHRNNGHAIEGSDFKVWYWHGKKHREDGPAVEFADGEKEWWINGQELNQEQFKHYVEMKKLNQQLQQDLKNNSAKINILKI